VPALEQFPGHHKRAGLSAATVNEVDRPLGIRTIMGTQGLFSLYYRRDLSN